MGVHVGFVARGHGSIHSCKGGVWCIQGVDGTRLSPTKNFRAGIESGWSVAQVQPREPLQQHTLSAGASACDAPLPMTARLATRLFNERIS